MRKLTLAAVAGALLLAGMTASGASATTFSGSCEMKGVIHMITPYHVILENRDYENTASGTCTGKVDGQPYDGPASVYIDGRMNKPMSCLFGIGNGVPGVVYFGSGSPNDVDATLLDVYTDHFHVFPVLMTNLQGAYNGEAVAVLSLAAGANRETWEACSGEGLHELPFEMKSQTVTELYG
jgi:hypothetical protein